MGKPKNTPEKFWNRVDQTGGPNACWEWTGSKLKTGGYGQAYFSGSWRAHRLAFFLTHGFKPEAVCHHCDNPPCCNPAHLFAGTKAINTYDMIAKGRHNTGPKRYGEQTSFAKLTSDQVREIKRRLVTDKQEVIAKQYSVKPSTISAIATGRTWSHIAL